MGLVTTPRARRSSAAATARSMAATIGVLAPRPAATGSTGSARAKASPPAAKSATVLISTRQPSSTARAASTSGSPTTTNGGSAHAARCNQPISVMSGPIPAGSPKVTASGGSRPNAMSAPAARTRSSEFDVGILSEIAQMALGQRFEFLGPEVLLHLLALLLVGFDRATPADGEKVDGARSGTRRQHIAILGAEQQGSCRFGDAARLDELQIVELGAGGVLGQRRHAFAAAEFAPQRLGFGEPFCHRRLIGGGWQRQRQLLHAELDAILAAIAAGGRHRAVDFALGDGNEGGEAAADDFAPAEHGPEPLLERVGIDTQTLQMLDELLLGHLVVFGEAFEHPPHFLVADFDAVLFRLLQLQAFLDQLLLGSLAHLRDQAGARAFDGLPLQAHAELLLALLENGPDLVGRLALVAVDHFLQNRAQLLIGALLLRQTLEVLLHLVADVGAERQEAGALLDLVGGHRFVVDEGDDALASGLVAALSSLLFDRRRLRLTAGLRGGRQPRQCHQGGGDDGDR